MSAKGGSDVEFQCGQWLARDQGDGNISRKLSAGSNDSDTKMYHVTVVTGSRRGAGTDANVQMQLFGSKNDSGPQRLESGQNGEPGRVFLPMQEPHYFLHGALVI